MQVAGLSRTGIMARMTATGTELFKGRHFDQQVIILCVRWYLSYKLSSRDLVDMIGERGIELAHTTILRWVQRYVPEFEKHCKRQTNPGQPREADQRAGVRLATSDSVRRFSPGSTSAR